jgi:ABC-type sugar transport system ATPase subunit
MKDGPTPEQRQQFEILFRPGHFWVILGERGSGKTSWAAQIATAIIKWYPNYRVFSNVLLKKKVRLDDGTETFVEYYPERYHKVQSMSEVFHLLPDVIERKETVLLILDEAMMASAGFAAGQTVLSADVRATTAFSSIIRKLRICVLLISQTPQLVMKRYREGGFVTGYMRRRQGLMPGYNIREVIEIVTIDADGNRIGSLVTRTSPTGLATPAHVAKVGDVIFDSAAPAQFGMGEYQKTGKRFDLVAAIAALNVIEEDAARALREHLANPPEPGQGVGVYEPSPSIPGVTPETVASPIGGAAGEIRELLLTTSLSNAEIAKLTGRTRQRVFQIRQELIHKGMLRG